MYVPQVREGGTDGKDLPLHVCTCVGGSARDFGCIVDGGGAVTAY